MKYLKRILTIALAFTLITGSAISVDAANHQPGCAATTSIQVCGTFRTQYSDLHRLHTNVDCARTAYIFDHYYNCAGCGVQTGIGSSKACNRSHQYCPSEYYLCR